MEIEKIVRFESQTPTIQYRRLFGTRLYDLLQEDVLWRLNSAFRSHLPNQGSDPHKRSLVLFDRFRIDFPNR